MSLLHKTVVAQINDIQLRTPQQHFYGTIFNDGTCEKVRVFPGPKGIPDPQLAQLLKTDAQVLKDSGLRLRIKITNHWPDESPRWTGQASPLSKQDEADQRIVHELLSKHGLTQAATELRSPQDVIEANPAPPIIANKPQKITSRNQKNQTELLGVACYEGKNPYELLTKSTARVEGKTDYPLMVFLRVIADQLGVEVCDLVNAVMWQSVKSGSIWDCQKDNGMP